MNEGLTRPKGPGHPVVGLRVNCPPLGPSGQQSSSGGSTASAVQLYSVQCICSCAAYPLCTVQLNTLFCRPLYNYFKHCTLSNKTSFLERYFIVKTDTHTHTHTHRSEYRVAPQLKSGWVSGTVLSQPQLNLNTTST